MELNQIRYFVELARTLHFTNAARSCNVSQPALTKSIQKLEAELGGELFHRERSPIHLTELGRLMLEPLQATLELARDAKKQAEAYRRRDSSPLRIGVELSIPTSLLAPVFATLGQSANNLAITVRQHNLADISARMLGGDLDFALLVERGHVDDRMHAWHLFTERYLVVCNDDHRFSRLDAIPLAELSKETLLLNADGSCPARRFVDNLFDQASATPRQCHFAGNMDQILEMVEANLGVAVTGERTRVNRGVRSRQIDNAMSLRSIALFAVAGRRMSATSGLFLKLMRARAWSRDLGENASVSP